MAFDFEFRGGVCKPTEHTTEKFLLFFVIGGVEIPFWQIKRDALARQAKASDPYKFVTAHNLIKIFTAEQGFGIAKRFHSFYVRLMPKSSAMVTIRPFRSNTSEYYFKGNVSFLKREEVLSVLDDENESKKFVRTQRVLPLDTLRSIVTVDHSINKRPVRHIRLSPKKNSIKKSENKRREHLTIDDII